MAVAAPHRPVEDAVPLPGTEPGGATGGGGDWFSQNAPPAAPTTPTAPGGGAPAPGGAFGSGVSTDPEAIKAKAMELFRARGVEPTPAQLDYVVKYGSKPDWYSDGQLRVGANPYLVDRAITGSDSSSVAAGSEGLIGNPSQHGFTNPNAGGGFGGSGMGGGVPLGQFGSLASGWQSQFQAPDIDAIRQMPGYQFALKEGIGALDNSAMARGTGLSGGHKKNLLQYATGLLDQTAQQKYQNALGEYKTSYDIFRNNQNDVFDRYDRMAQRGTGAAQTATGS